jgi:S-adenosylmethionine hydrolase
MKKISILILLFTITFNYLLLFAKILPPSPEELERRKKLEEQAKKPVIKPTTKSKSVQDNLPSRSIERQSGKNVAVDEPQKNKNSAYNNSLEMNNADINSRSKTDINKTTTAFEDNEYQLPKVDNEYIAKTKNRINAPKQLNNDPLVLGTEGAIKFFSESDLESYNDLVNPYSFKISPFPAIVMLKNSNKNDSNIEAILYSNAPRSKVFEFKIPENGNLAGYALLNNLIYRSPNTIFAVDYNKQYEIIAVKTKSLHYLFIPNNGMLSIIKATIGVIEVRKINLYAYMPIFKNSEYAYYYLISRLASGQIDFSNVGAGYPKEDLILDNYADAKLSNNTITSSVVFINELEDIITNIPKNLFAELNLLIGDSVSVLIYKDNQLLYQENLKYQEDKTDSALQSFLGLTKTNLVLFNLKDGISVKSKSIKYGQGYTLKIVKK